MPLLQRYVFCELLKVFSLALTGLTVLLVFVGVVGEAARSGLGPQQILQILPYIVPSLLPFTIPATLLLTVCVVYGRLAGDHEVTAVRAAGISVMALLWPSIFLGGILSLLTLVLTDQFIPWARANIQRTVTSAMEDIFLDMLRSQMQVVDPQNGISVTVMGVKGKTLLMPTFRHSLPNGTVVTLQAQEGSLEFDLERQEVVLHLVRGHLDVDGSSIWFIRERYPFPLPRSRNKTVPRELTVRTIERELKGVARERETLRNKQLVSAVLALSEGDFEKFRQPEFLYYDFTIDDLTGRYNRLHTEVHSRFALSCSCLFFVLLGSPFSMLQARRQFLTSFILCFLPILLIYYPVVMLCINLSKENDLFDPTWAMWIGNGLMFLAGMSVLRRLLRN